LHQAAVAAVRPPSSPVKDFVILLGEALAPQRYEQKGRSPVSVLDQRMVASLIDTDAWIETGFPFRLEAAILQAQGMTLSVDRRARRQSNLTTYMSLRSRSITGVVRIPKNG